MSADQIIQLRRMLAERPPLTNLAERREAFETMAAKFPFPETAEEEEIELQPGLTARWIRDEHSTSERAILYLHGGAFMLGSSRAYRELTARIAAASGAQVLVPDYRLAPENPFPAALEDSCNALQWLQQQGFAAGDLAVAGDSCGGNLACAVLQETGAEVASLWLTSPWLDLTLSGASIHSRAARDPFIDTKGMPGSVQIYAPDQQPRDPRLSPLFGDVDRFPPTLIQVGSEEVLLDDSRRFAAQLEAAEVETVFQEWVDMVHVWTFFGPLLEEAHWAVAQAGAFIQRHFQRQ